MLAKYCIIVLCTVFGLLQGSKPTSSSTLYATTSSLFGSIDQVVPETSSNVKRQKSCVFDSSCDVQTKSVNKDTVAFFTYYETYPAICPDSPSYNPNISADDCADLSCCEFSGDLAAVGHKPIDFVKETNMVAFYDSSDPDGLYWAEAYANKTIEVSKTFNGRKYIFNATILDNCVNSDCDDCCIRDSTSTGYLLVMEYFTVMRNFGSVAAVDGLISFRIFH
eukprot:gene23770-32156_t